MHLTKDEILEKYYRNHKKRISYEENVYSAMEEFAEQEAKAFANWMSRQVNHDLRMSEFWKKFRQEVF